MVNIQEVFRQFEELTARILEANGVLVNSRETRAPDRGFDYIATFANDRWVIEVKYYRTKRAQISLLESAASKLVTSFQYDQATKAMLIVSCTIDPTLRLGLEEKYGAVFADRSDIYLWAQKSPELLDALTTILETEESPSPGLAGRTLAEVLKRPVQPPGVNRIVDSTGTNLCEELRSLKRGKSTWVAYEKLCYRILEYLFSKDLLGWHRQKRTDDGFNRYDYVCRIRPTTEFWQFLLDHLSTRYVLFEFKNYTNKIKQGQVLSTEKYLLERGLRRVAIILSRAGSDRGAMAMMQGAMREHGKLMLAIGDDQVCEMLHMKENGEDPSDLLFAVADNFLLTLPR